MICKWLIPSILLFAVSDTILVDAQTIPRNNPDRGSLLERIDEFGQSLLGGIFGEERATTRGLPPTATAPHRPNPAQPPVPNHAVEQHSSRSLPKPAGVPSGEHLEPRAGSILAAPGQRTQEGEASANRVSTVMRESAAVGRLNPSPNQSDDEVRNPGLAVAAETDATGNPANRPLHQRLSIIRNSAFGEVSADSPVPQPDMTPSGSVSPRQPTAAERPAAGTEHQGTAQTAEAGVIRPGSHGGVYSPTIRHSVADPAASEGTQAFRAGSAGMPGGSDTTVAASDGVLFFQKGPILHVETFGPRTITIGKESSYRVTMQNSGEVPAEGVVVFVELPPWADVLGTEASVGSTHLPTAGLNEGPFVWRIGRLAARGSERLVLRLVPRKSQPLDLAVRWEYQPISRQAVIEVQEPRLELQMDGPREVFFGKREAYTLRLKNTGTGKAESLIITMSPVGTGTDQPASHQLGNLGAGEERTVHVELTARQANSVSIRVEVRGEGGVHAELAENILVRRPELQVAASGPQVRFVGSEATYSIRIANPGNAPANNIVLSAELPAGATYLSGIDGARVEPNGARVSWTVGRLEAGSDRLYEMTASLSLPGDSRLKLAATADDNLNDSTEALTRVETIADLALEVDDPGVPVPVGSETMYRLRIRNRGSKAAENIEVIAYFSRGIEPVSAEGGTHRIGPGQVVFSPIGSLAAGGDVELSVRARAEQPGNHIFRAEMHCKPLDSRVVREETTHFYRDGALMAGEAAVEPVSTADRRAAAGESIQSPPQPAPEPRR